MPSSGVIIRKASTAAAIVRLFSSDASPLPALHDIRVECLSAAAEYFEKQSTQQKRIIDEILPRFVKLKRENARLKQIMKAQKTPQKIEFYKR